MSSVSQRAQLAYKFHGLEVGPRDILHEAHDEPVVLRHCADQGRHLRLPQCLVGLETPLPADEIIGARLLVARGDDDGLFQADRGDVLHNLRELRLVAYPRVEQVNAGYGDHFNGAHAASSMEICLAMPKKNSSVSNRKA